MELSKEYILSPLLYEFKSGNLAKPNPVVVIAGWTTSAGSLSVRREGQNQKPTLLEKWRRMTEHADHYFAS